jgi:uncharacterized alpha-E superfamily protein
MYCPIARRIRIYVRNVTFYSFMIAHNKMPRSIYGDCRKGTQCTYTIPPNQNVQQYITQTNTIIQEFRTDLNKQQAIERLQTLRQLLTTVVTTNRNSGASAV